MNSYNQAGGSTPNGATGGLPDGPAAFLNQPFSAATEMILKRLRGGGGGMGMITHDEVAGLNVTQTPGYEDVRRSVLESMRTTSTFTPTTSTPNKGFSKKGSAKSSANNSAKKVGRPKKRRKMKQESEEDESESASELEDEEEISEEEHTVPAVTLSGRKVVRPTQFVPEPKNAQTGKRKGLGGRKSSKAMDNTLCKRCGRGHSPKTNMIVFCDGCDKGWHQMCHDPMITDDIVKDESAEWFCADCAEKRQKRAAMRQKSSTPLSTPSHTPKPKPVWHDMSTAEVSIFLLLTYCSHTNLTIRNGNTSPQCLIHILSTSS